MACAENDEGSFARSCLRSAELTRVVCSTRIWRAASGATRSLSDGAALAGALFGRSRLDPALALTGVLTLALVRRGLARGGRLALVDALAVNGRGLLGGGGRRGRGGLLGRRRGLATAG